MAVTAPATRVRQRGRSDPPAWRSLQAPDPAPAIGLRKRLERARAAGLPFDEAWPSALAEALSIATADRFDRGEWRRALEDTKTDWQEAYDRTGSPLKLSRELVTRHDPTERTNHLIIA